MSTREGDVKWLTAFDTDDTMYLVRGDLPDDEAIRRVIDSDCPCDTVADFEVNRRGWWRTVPCGHGGEHTIHYEPTEAQTRGGFLAVDVRPVRWSR